ncbi:YdcF family protein [Gordonia sp. NPDC062954]|uniref:YdcF family protein n=1 Tax=Gordonia aquimaris TaxID=2984863 RepID=A0A9X3D361_9ACTN|nr:YdcF family protein [Gordonia aquimaris]MCX2963634.1 YdcF family protein [Gordonia aquimaris]
MTRVKRARLAAVGVVATAAVGGLVIGALPVDHSAQPGVRPAVTAMDPSTFYNSAQQKFAAGDVTGGLESLQQMLSVVPVDPYALALQAIWSAQVDDAAGSDAALAKLNGINRTLHTTARNIIAGVDAAAQIVPDTSPKTVTGRTAIVILGYGLNGNGKMAPELIRRVTAGKAQAEAAASAPIVVAGGAPKKGITEAAAMKKWLVANGVDAGRITEEGRSGSTVANAQNTAEILRGQGINDIILITSPNHIRRAAADFAAVGLRSVATVTTATELDKYREPLTRDRQKGIRLEATRAAEIPATRTAGLPLPDNLPDTGPGLIPEFGEKLLESLLDAGSSAIDSLPAE